MTVSANYFRRPIPIFSKPLPNYTYAYLVIRVGLSNAAKEKLRLNMTELHKPPTLAEIWQNLLVYKDQGDKSATDATLGTVKSASKVRQLLNFTQYRVPITQALRNRGVWPMFTGGRLGLFLPMRAIEENVRFVSQYILCKNNFGS